MLKITSNLKKTKQWIIYGESNIKRMGAARRKFWKEPLTEVSRSFFMGVAWIFFSPKDLPISLKQQIFTDVFGSLLLKVSRKLLLWILWWCLTGTKPAYWTQGMTSAPLFMRECPHFRGLDLYLPPLTILHLVKIRLRIAWRLSQFSVPRKRRRRVNERTLSED